LPNNTEIVSSDKYNFVLPCGLGDTYFICCYKNIYEKIHNVKIHFIIKPSHEIIMKMFEIHDYVCADLNKDFYKKNTFSHKPQIGAMYIAHPDYNNKRLIKKWKRGLLNFRELYTEYLEIPNQSKICFPLKKIEKAFTLENIKLGKCIFISISATSIVQIDKSYWQNLVSSYLQQGYTIINNCIGEGDELEGCLNLNLSLAEIIYIASRCHKSYCLRSGLCDLLFYFLGDKLQVIYPNKNLLDLYSINNSFQLDNKWQVAEIIIDKKYVCSPEIKKIKFLFFIPIIKKIQNQEMTYYLWRFPVAKIKWKKDNSRYTYKLFGIKLLDIHMNNVNK